MAGEFPLDVLLRTHWKRVMETSQQSILWSCHHRCCHAPPHGVFVFVFVSVLVQSCVSVVIGLLKTQLCRLSCLCNMCKVYV